MAPEVELEERETPRPPRKKRRPRPRPGTSLRWLWLVLSGRYGRRPLDLPKRLPDGSWSYPWWWVMLERSGVPAFLAALLTIAALSIAKACGVTLPPGGP